MALAFDAVSSSTASGETQEWTHTPAGTPSGIVVIAALDNLATNIEYPEVKYGDTYMNRVLKLPGEVTEQGTLWVYFLANPDPGPQTVIFERLKVAINSRAVAVSLTSDRKLSVVDAKSIAGSSVTNPSIGLNSDGLDALAFGALYSGKDLAAEVSAGAGETDLLEHDFTGQICSWVRSSASFNGETNLGWTAGAASAAAVGVAIGEAAIPVSIGSGSNPATDGTKWSFVLTALDGTPIGEILNASSRSVSLGLSRAATASFQVRAQNPRLLDLYQQDNLLQVWQDSTLRFWGPVVSCNYATQEDGTDPTIAVNAVSPAWRLANRLAGKSGSGTALSGDKAGMAKTLIDTTNSESETGIKTVTVKSESTGSYTAGPYKPVLDCISELAHGLDGFDWYLRPITDTAGKIAEFVAGPVIGGTQKDTVFEYGVGRHNIRSMTFLRDLGGMMNRAYHIPDEGADAPGATVISKEDPVSIGYRGLFEGPIDSLGLSDTTLREQWANANVEVRREPRLVVTMTPDIFDPAQPGRVPVFGTDYNIGDFVRARSVMYGTQLFDGYVRVYNVQIDVDDNGRATTTPTLVDEETPAVNTGGGIGSGPGRGGGGGAKENPHANSIILE